MKRKTRILYVDPDPADRKQVIDAVEAWDADCRLDEASTKEEFEEKWAAGVYDLVMAELDMPGYEGLGILDKVRETKPGVPVIIFTGTGSWQVAVETMKRGAVDYVIKSPESINRLGQTIGAALGNARVEEIKRGTLAGLDGNERNYRQLVDLLHEGIWVIDDGGITTYVNEPMAQMLDYSVREMHGRPLMSFMKEEMSGKCRQLLARKREGVKEQQEFEFQKKDGTSLHVLMETSPVYDEDGRFVGSIAGIIDITERKRLESEIQQILKMEAIGHLAGGIAHDFNNLLTVITGNTDLLLSEIGQDDRFYREIFEIHEAGVSAARLTGQLLAFSRQQALDLRTLNVNELLLKTKMMISRVIREDIELEFDLDSDLDQIYADPVQLEQVILNITINASDAMPDGGVILFHTENHLIGGPEDFKGVKVDPGDYVLLRITDTGVGMIPEVKKRIFEPFFTTKGIGKGTGLGLATVYGIVRQFNGHISVESDIGKGSAFTILFPLARMDSEQDTDEPQGGTGEKGHGTVLLVEDHESVRKYTADVLGRAGYTVFSARDPGEALALSEENGEDIDLIITDVVMPGMSGITLAEKIKAQRKDIGILYISGYAEESVTCGRVLIPGVNLLNKPFTRNKLLNKVGELVRNRKLKADD